MTLKREEAYTIRMAFQTELSVCALDFGFSGFNFDAEELVRVDGGFFFVEYGRHVERGNDRTLKCLMG
jgi:hypothetical protein